VTWIVIGGSGIVGSGFVGALNRRGEDVRRVVPRWEVAGAAAVDLAQGLAAELRGSAAATVVWAAGVGHVGATGEQMRAEADGLRGLCEELRALPPEVTTRLRVVFASSAGALFAGCGSAVIDEHTEPRPVSDYGREKLAQEQLLQELSEQVGCQVLVCRISNVFGLASGVLTPRGLISTAVRATRLRQPLTIYVSPDTRRDYVFNADVAAQALAGLERAGEGCTRLLVRDDHTRTVAEVMSVVGRVSRRRVPVTYADRPATRLQPRVLRFAPSAHGPDEVRRTQMETAVHLMLRAPLVR
jgi:UDP-glucose 4-epimerase